MYENETGDEPRQQDTQANKGSPLLSELYTLCFMFLDVTHQHSVSDKK